MGHGEGRRAPLTKIFGPPARAHRQKIIGARRAALCPVDKTFRPPARAHRLKIIGARRAALCPVDKNFRAPSRGGQAKNRYTKSERPSHSCTVTWARSERVNLYIRQIMVLPRKTKIYSRGPAILYRLTLLPSPIYSALSIL